MITIKASPMTAYTPESSRLRLRLHFNDSCVYAYSVNTIAIQLGRLFSCWRLSLGRGRFSVRSYCWPGERQVTLRLRSECLPAAFHTFLFKNMGIPSAPSDCTLALSPLCQQLLTCTKNGQPCRRSSIELHKRGEWLELKHSQTFPNYERNRPFQEHYQGLSW